MGAVEDNIIKVKEWIENSFSKWLKDNSNIENINIEVNDELITVDLDGREFNISQSEIDEIVTVMDDVNNIGNPKNIRLDNEYIRDIFNYDNDSVLVPIVSNEKEIAFDNNKNNISLVYSKDGRVFKSSIESGVSWRVIYILLTAKYNKISVKSDNIDEELELLGIFNEFSYLIVRYENATLNSEEKSNLVLNVVYCFNNINSKLLLPLGICSSNNLSFFSISSGDEEVVGTNSEVRIPFNKYDSEALIYYLIAQIHDDFRFVYLDLYHVLEYYFDRVSLASIRKIIKHGLEEPSIYFNDDKIQELAKKVKDIIIVDKGNYKETQSLSLLLDILGINNILNSIGDNNEEKVELVLPKLKDNDKEELKEIRIEYFRNNKKYNLNKTECSEEKVLERLRNRIYAIRNSIAHSKEEFQWRLKPSSKEIDLLKGKDLDLIRYCSSEIIKQFKNSGGF